MGLFNGEVRILGAGQAAGQDPDTGRPVGAVDGPELYRGAAAVIDDASQETLDRYGSRGAGGRGLLIFEEDLVDVGPAVDQEVEAESEGYLFRGRITAFSVLTRSVQVEWRSAPQPGALPDPEPAP